MRAAPALDDDEGTPAAPERPSKTRRKQASHELQDLGEALVALPEDRSDALPLPETLHDAVRAYRRTRTHEGRRRQMQYIGKLMRGTDTAPIRQAVLDLQLGRAKDALSLHETERWRAQLIASDDAVTGFVEKHPGADAQQLRTLIRNARKEIAEAKPPRAQRELFRLIRELGEAA